MGQFPEAIQAFREAVRLKPADAEAWFRLGLVYVAQGDGEGVEEISRRLGGMDPVKARLLHDRLRSTEGASFLAFLTPIRPSWKESNGGNGHSDGRQTPIR